MSCIAEPLDFGSFPKHPAERLRVELDFFPQLARFWRPGKFYRAGDVVRSTKPTGFAYRAKADATSGHREPRWSASIGHPTFDGSVEWDPIIANHDGVDLVVDSAWTLPSGLVLAGAPNWDGAVVEAFVSGGTDGVDYDGLVVVDTQGGQRLSGVFTCKVRSERIDACA